MATHDKEKPILFSGPMVRAILADKKTVTRRIIKPQPVDIGGGEITWDGKGVVIPGGIDYKLKPEWITKYARYQPGDIIWVKETWRVGAWSEDNEIAVDYIADNYSRKEFLLVEDDAMFEKLWQQSTDDAAIYCGVQDKYEWSPGESPCRKRPSIFMPKWACRLWLECVSVLAERLQEITEEDAVRDGVENREAFRELWNSINGKSATWESNPWVWRYEFTVKSKTGKAGMKSC